MSNYKTAERKQVEAARERLAAVQYRLVEVASQRERLAPAKRQALQEAAQAILKGAEPREAVAAAMGMGEASEALVLAAQALQTERAEAEQQVTEAEQAAAVALVKEAESRLDELVSQHARTLWQAWSQVAEMQALYGVLAEVAHAHRIARRYGGAAMTNLTLERLENALGLAREYQPETVREVLPMSLDKLRVVARAMETEMAKRAKERYGL